MPQVSIKFADLTIEEIRDILEQTGYKTTDREFAFAKDNDYFKYIGSVDRRARYLVAFCDSEEPGKMYVSIVYVYISRAGRLEAEYSVFPIFESEDEDEIAQYIEKKCN